MLLVFKKKKAQTPQKGTETGKDVHPDYLSESGADMIDPLKRFFSFVKNPICDYLCNLRINASLPWDRKIAFKLDIYENSCFCAS